MLVLIISPEMIPENLGLSMKIVDNAEAEK
jgi:hypothetical protein